MIAHVVEDTSRWAVVQAVPSAPFKKKVKATSRGRFGEGRSYLTHTQS